VANYVYTQGVTVENGVAWLLRIPERLFHFASGDKRHRGFFVPVASGLKNDKRGLL